MLRPQKVTTGNFPLLRFASFPLPSLTHPSSPYLLFPSSLPLCPLPSSLPYLMPPSLPFSLFLHLPCTGRVLASKNIYTHSYTTIACNFKDLHTFWHILLVTRAQLERWHLAGIMIGIRCTA